VRLLIQKGMALIYLVAFLSAYNQFVALLGERGLLPVKDLLKTSFFKRPTLFYWYYSDRFFKIIALCGILISLLMLFGFLEHLPLIIYIILWLILWLLYLSIVNIGQTFYAFGWESMLLEAGLITAFLGNGQIQVSIIPILILRWM